MKCCVIGGTGFVGAHLVEYLHQTERTLTVVGRNTLPTRPLPEGVRYIATDYGNKNILYQLLQDTDEIILLAHTTVPRTSYDDPVKDVLGNVPEAVSLFEIASNVKVKKMVFVSSGGTVYGKAQHLPIHEGHPTNPISPYGISKLTIEKYAYMYKELRGLPVVCVRPGNAYGEGQRPFAAQGFIPTAIASALQNKEIVIFGEPGTIRDYIHVQDLIAGIVAALESGVPGECYNLGSGVGRNNRQVLNSLLPAVESTGCRMMVRNGPPRLFDVPENILDSTKIRNLTGWYPRIDFDEGLRRVWDWFLMRRDK